jgi:hypothetical protein
MSLVESNAAFAQRCSELDRTGNFGNALTAQNINTFSAMAFALGTPQTPPTDQQFDVTLLKKDESLISPNKNL